MFLSSDSWCVCSVCVSVFLRRTMLTKDKKPDVKDEGKAAAPVIPPRPDTPKMFKAALKVTEMAGMEGTFTKLAKSYKPFEGTAEVRHQHLLTHVTPLIDSWWQ